MAQKGRDCEDAPYYKPVFVDTNLDTHLAILVSSLDTISDIKRKILTGHSKCFREFGQIEVHALKVKRKGKLYSLSDLEPVTSLFTGTSRAWFLSADISAQSCHNEAVDLLSNEPNACIFTAGPSIASHLQRGYEKDKARKKRKVGVHVHSSNGNDAVEMSSTDKDLADTNPELKKNLDLSAADSKQCHNAGIDVGSPDQNKIKDKSTSETNHFKTLSAELKSGSGADIEQLVGPHSEGEKGAESHGRDMKVHSAGSDKTKGAAMKQSMRMTKLEVMNDDKFIECDASANASAKPLAAPLGHQLKRSDISEGPGTTEEGGLGSGSLQVQCNNSTVIPTNMDEDVTEALGRVESDPDAKGREKEVAKNGSFVDSGMTRSKKRKNTCTWGDVSHQMDIKGKEELGVNESGDMDKGTKMLAESELTRPLKKSRTGSRPTSSRSEVEKVETKSLSSAAKKINKVSLISSSHADDEIRTKVQQLTMTNLGRDVNLQQEDDNACENSVEPLQLSQVQKGRFDTVKNNGQPKKKTIQSRNDASLDKDRRSAPAEVSLNAAKNKADIMKAKVESSSLKAIDSYSVTMLNKSLDQHKYLKDWQKIKQHKLSDLSTKTVVQKQSIQNGIISKCISFFIDESSSSSEDESGGDDSNSSTETPNNYHVSSSDDSEEESRGSWESSKQGISNNGGSASNSKGPLLHKIVTFLADSYKRI